MTNANSEQSLGSLASGDAPLLETLANMTVDTMSNSGFDPKTYFLIRIAGMAALDADPISYLVNAAAASEVLGPKELRGLLIALAPVIGSARTMSAAGNMLRAFATAMDIEEVAAAAEERQMAMAASYKRTT